MSYREIRRFKACTAEGKVYTILERARQIGSSDVSSGRRHVVDGSRDWVTSGGLSVNDNDDGTFEIVQTDEIVREIKDYGAAN